MGLLLLDSAQAILLIVCCVLQFEGVIGVAAPAPVDTTVATTLADLLVTTTSSAAAAGTSGSTPAVACSSGRPERQYWRGLPRHACILTCSDQARLYSRHSVTAHYHALALGTTLQYQHRRARGAAGVIWLKAAVASNLKRHGWVRSVSVKRC